MTEEAIVYQKSEVSSTLKNIREALENNAVPGYENFLEVMNSYRPQIIDALSRRNQGRERPILGTLEDNTCLSMLDAYVLQMSKGSSIGNDQLRKDFIDLIGIIQEHIENS